MDATDTAREVTSHAGTRRRRSASVPTVIITMAVSRLVRFVKYPK
jgi:hypothetical protein